MIRFYHILIVLLAKSAFGQLATTPQSAANLVQNTLVGPGVTVSNVSFTGSTQALGRFTATSVPGFNLASGVILTTGNLIGSGEGPIGPNNEADAGFNNGSLGYAQLSALIGGTATFNASILEFDFIPLSDTVKFNYIFASEEYPEYVGSTFNDVFAFFISGPGIAGGTQNMAQLPNAGGIVSINNVNAGSNPSYFYDNGTGDPVGAPNTLQYDGFTTKLTAISPVTCGATYHLKIAIADVGDGIFDSGIFLEANSLTANVSVDIAVSISNNAYNDPTIMAEGCTDGTVKITRVGVQTATTPALTIPITMSGTATELLDYTDIPSSITFAPGETVKIINFTTNADALTEGQESIIFDFGIEDPCGNSETQTFTLYIRDILPLTVTVEDTLVLCANDPVILDPLIIGGGGIFSIVWSTGSTDEIITVTPTGTTTYTVTVTESCLNQTATASVTVTVPIYLPIILVTTPNIVDLCPFNPHVLTVEVTGGTGVYNYQWTTTAPLVYDEVPLLNPNDFLMGTAAIQNILPPGNATYTVTVKDQCDLTANQNVVVTILTPPLVAIPTPKQLICPGDSVEIGVLASAGAPAYICDWQHSNETTPSVWVNPQRSITYTVFVSDQCNTFYLPKSIEVEVIKPTADFSFAGNLLFENLPVTFYNSSIDAVNYIWNFGNGTSSTVANPNAVFDRPSNYTITLIAIDYLGCRDTISKVIPISPEWYFYVPNTFTPDDDGNVNRVFKMSGINIVELSILIFNHWGEVVFEADTPKFEWNGSYKGKTSQDGVYTYVIKYKNILGEELESIGHVSLLR